MIRIYKTLTIATFCSILISCDSTNTEESLIESKTSSFFNEIESVKFGNQDLLLPEGFSYQVLFQGGKDSVVRADGQKFLSKESNDMLAYLPINGSSEHGYLYTSHETYSTNPDLGDGGGGAIMEIKKENGNWNVIKDVRHIDFSTVGETARNCGGTLTPNGTILTCEEVEPMNNRELSYLGKAFSDTSDLTNGMKAFENQGWMVEIDPVTGKALHKLYGMGRFPHEDAHCMEDGKTVYLSDDNDPAVFFKFVADEKVNYTKGQLSAFKQTGDGKSGSWLDLPRDTNALIYARSLAIEMGATLFIRHEWMDVIDGKLYIAETGKDVFDWTKYLTHSSPASHFKIENGIVKDPFGRILVFDPSDNSMKVHLEAGNSTKNETTNFSNPDCIVKLERDGKTYLVMSEDLVGISKNRISKEAIDVGEKYCEVYILDMSIENPTVDDLTRFAVSPNGAETTGDCFTPDGKTMFLNVQHPNSNNKEPFNSSTTLAIEGF